MAYATIEDVAVRWAKVPSEDESALIGVRLGDVERMIRRRIPLLDDLIADGILDVDDVRMVEAEAVLRTVRNPDGFVSETDGNYTYQLSHATAARELELTPEEWKILGYEFGGGMFTLVPNFETEDAG